MACAIACLGVPVNGQVIPFSHVVGSAIATRLDGELVKPSSSQVHVFLHGVCHRQCPCELRVSVIYKLFNSEHPCGCQPLSTGFSSLHFAIQFD